MPVSTPPSTEQSLDLQRRMEAFRMRFIRWMEEEGTTAKQLATELDIDYQRINKVVNGSLSKPPSDLLFALLSHYPTLDARWLLAVDDVADSTLQGYELHRDPASIPDADLRNHITLANRAITRLLSENNGLLKKMLQLQQHLTDIMQSLVKKR